MQAQISSLQSSKRKAEEELQSIRDSVDELDSDVKTAEEKARRSAAEVARLEDELASAQQAASAADRARAVADKQAKELQARLEEVEAAGGKALKNKIKTLEQVRLSLFVTLSIPLEFKIQHEESSYNDEKQALPFYLLILISHPQPKWVENGDRHTIIAIFCHIF